MSFRKIKPKSFDELGESPSKRENRKSFPRFRIELTHLPEAKKWEIGKEYIVTLKIKQTGISISRFQNDAEFDITAIDPQGLAVKTEDNPGYKGSEK